MSYPETFKKGFIKQIEKELKKCEIIYNPNTKGIWFVNREEKYWYLEYKVETNYLWWRYEFFDMFKRLFCMSDEVFNEVISEWVENKLNCEVLTTESAIVGAGLGVEETLNCKVDSTKSNHWIQSQTVEETLNCKVLSTSDSYSNRPKEVEDALNCEVLTTYLCESIRNNMVKNTLNLK